MCTHTSSPPPIDLRLNLFLKRWPLEDQTLGLLAALFLKLLNVDVLPDEDGNNAKRDEARARDNHQALRVGICTNNSSTLRCAVEEAHLSDHVAEDKSRVDLGLLGEKLVQLTRCDVVPDGTRNGITNRCSKAAKQTPERTHTGNLLVSDWGHDCKLTTLCKDTCAETDKDLCQSQDSNGRVGLSVRDQQAGSEEKNRYAAHGNPFEVTSVGDEESDGRSENGRSEGKGVENIPSMLDTQSVNDL